MSQPQANPKRTALRTTPMLALGKVPGWPRVMGDTWVLGAAP